MNIILMGPQASGKGTQARKLVETFGFVHVEMGQILRTIAEEDSERGTFTKELLKEGKLFPHEFTFNAVKEFLSEQDAPAILFDSYPRNIVQKENIEGYLAENGKKIDVLINLNVPEELILERLSSRVVSKRTGKIYNLKTNPPGADENPEDLIQRYDLTEEAIANRFEFHRRETGPMIEAYRNEGLLIDVDASKPIDEVFNDICKEMSNRGLSATPLKEDGNE